MNLDLIHVNDKNPRTIRTDRFEKLCKSIEEFPEMLELRKIILDENGLILGGNMRFKAIQELGWELKEEWFEVADKLDEEKKKRFIIEDNIGLGEWDWELLANEWDKETLEQWGLDLEVWKNFEGTNTEVDTNVLGEDLDIECPKCHFKFKNV